MDDLLLKAIIIGGVLSTFLAPLGCFVIWRGMTFFSEALSHSSILGISLALLWGINPFWGILGIILMMGAALSISLGREDNQGGPSLAILMYGAMSAGIILIQKIPTQINPESILFGDILTVSQPQFYGMLSVGLVIALFLYTQFDKLLFMAINNEMARSEGLPVNKLNALFLVMMGLGVSSSIQAVGVLLVPALVIIPGAVARLLVKSSPGDMILASVPLCFFITSMGIFISFQWDLSTGPTIALFGAFLYGVVRTSINRLALYSLKLFKTHYTPGR